MLWWLLFAPEVLQLRCPFHNLWLWSVNSWGLRNLSRSVFFLNGRGGVNWYVAILVCFMSSPLLTSLHSFLCQSLVLVWTLRGGKFLFVADTSRLIKQNARNLTMSASNHILVTCDVVRNFWVTPHSLFTWFWGLVVKTVTKSGEQPV